MPSLEEKLCQESNESCPCWRREGMYFMLRPLYSKERIQEHIEAKVGWVTFCRRVKCLVRTGNRTPGRPARSVVSIPITLPSLHQHFWTFVRLQNVFPQRLTSSGDVQLKKITCINEGAYVALLMKAEFIKVIHSSRIFDVEYIYGFVMLGGFVRQVDDVTAQPFQRTLTPARATP